MTLRPKMPARRALRRRRVLWLALAIPCAAAALQFTPPATEPDLATGKDINGVCAGCHGDYGQGGKNGEYPRIAGLPLGYLYNQVKLFQKNTRPNLPMLEHVHERQLSDQEILDISAFLTRIQLPTRQEPMSENDPRFNAYERLMEAKRVMQVPVAEGDKEKGRAIYNKECRSCHGTDGWGDSEKNVPQLAGQYTEYLWRQIDKFNAKVRVHDPDDPEDEMLKEFSREELRDVLAFLSIMDD